jgi:hypothetical protein
VRRKNKEEEEGGRGPTSHVNHCDCNLNAGVCLVSFFVSPAFLRPRQQRLRYSQSVPSSTIACHYALLAVGDGCDYTRRGDSMGPRFSGRNRIASQATGDGIPPEVSTSTSTGTPRIVTSGAY